MLHHDKVVLMRSSDGEDVRSVDEAFFSFATGFWPFLLLDWKVKTLEKGQKARREQQCNKKRLQKMKKLTGIGSVL